MTRHFRFVLLLAVVILVLPGLPGTVPDTHAEEAVTFRIASLAPAG